MYTIGQVSELFGLPISTLRYYDKEGLFPNMKRVSGIRQFGSPAGHRMSEKIRFGDQGYQAVYGLVQPRSRNL